MKISNVRNFKALRCKKFILALCLAVSAGTGISTTVNANSAQAISSFEQCATIPMTALGGLIKLGDARLYMENCQARDQILTPIPKLFSIHLTRDVEGEKLSQLANKYLAKNLDAAIVESGVFSCITNHYVNAKDGDRYDVQYIPESGLSLILNDQTIAECKGGSVLAQYFSIWFGEKPFSRRLKKALLQTNLND